MTDTSRKPASKSTFHFLAGLGSGTLSAVLLQPIDLLKTRVQQSGHHSLLLALRDIRASSTSSSRPRGLLPSLWRGALPSALRTGFGSAIYFSSLNAIRTHVFARIPFFAAPQASGITTGSITAAGSSDGKNRRGGGGGSSSSLVRLSNTGNLVAGASARTFAGFVLMPLTVIKVRFESSLYAYPSLPAAARDIYRAEGIRGFFSGFGATAARDAPYAGLYVLFYELFKKNLSAAFPPADNIPRDQQGGGVTMGVSRAAAVNFSSGALAAATCSTITNPFDAVKTRIQLQPDQYRNMLHAARRMLIEEGPKSFLDGLGLRMTRKALSSALAWTVYEELIRRAEVSWSSSGGNHTGKERVL